MRWDALEAVVRLARIQAQAAASTMSDNEVLSVAVLYPEWAPGDYDVGDVCNHGGQTWQCVQTHDSTATPDWSPGAVAALWAPYHASAPLYARPWIAPTGAHDAYQTGECMIWTDGQTYRCLQDTVVHDPGVLPAAWEIIKEVS